VNRDEALGPFGLFDHTWRQRMTFDQAVKATADHLAIRISKANIHTAKFEDERRELERLRGYVRPVISVISSSSGQYKHISAKERRKRSKPGKGKYADKE